MNQFKKGIEDIRALQLSADEKRMLYARIMSRPVLSPYKYWVRYSVVSLLMVMCVGGSATFAAEQSVPGDFLYPTKIKVTEPARDLLAQQPADHARWESEKASRRLKEAETLIKRNELTPERSKDIEERFQEHARAATDALNTLSRVETTSTAHTIEKEFDDTLTEHARVLASSTEKQSKDDHDTSSLEKKIKEVRTQFRKDEELRARSEREREKRERDRDISDHDRSKRKESDSVKKVQEEDESDRSRPDSSE